MNKKLGIALAIMSFISSITVYFDVMTVLTIAVSVILAALISILAMLQVYHHQEFGNQNSGIFWMCYSAIAGVIMIAIIYSTGLNLISDHLSLSLLSGMFPTILPAIGVLLGDIGRILFQGKSSTI